MEQKPLVIANPAAQRGRTGRELPQMLTPLRGALGELDVVITKYAGHAQELAAAAAGERRQLVVSLGGDGTLNEIINGLLSGAADAASSPPPASSLPRVGIVETGTGGDFGRSLGVPHRLEAYVAALSSGRERPIDVGLARFAGKDGMPASRLWVNVVSGGIGGLVDIYNETAPHWMSGRVAYGQAAFRGIFTCPRVTLHCRAVLPDGSPYERVMRAHAVAVCNGHTFGGGMLIGPEARPDDGLLQVVSFETRTKAQLIRRFLTVYRGTHVLEEGVNSLVCRSVELTPVPEDEGMQRATERPRGVKARLPFAGVGSFADGTPPGVGKSRRKHGVFPLDIDGDARGDVPLAVGLLPGALLIRA